MFEKIREKAKLQVAKGKVWVANNKFEIGYAVGAVVSIVTMTVINDVNNKHRIEENRKRYSPEIGVLRTRKDADERYSYCGHADMTVDKISDSLMSEGVSGSEKVVGALIYIQREQ